MKNNDKRKTYVKPERTLKVYKVTFAELSGKDEFLNVDSKTVLADRAQEAINEAFTLISKKESKTYFVQEVELITVID